MKCPKCDHVSDQSALVKCSHCGEAFERGLLEELGHLDYLQKWIEGHRSDIGDYRAGIIQGRVRERRRKILDEIRGPKAVPQAKPQPGVETVSPASTPIAPRIEARPTSVVETRPAQKERAPAAPIAQPEARETPIPQMNLSASPPKPKPAPKPAAPPKPKRPPIDWRKVITEAATSGALLRALLYLGAFMIVVSATVLVIRFWDQFHRIVQLLFIASLPLTFYAGGWALRIRLKLIQAGTVLTGIGALLVVVDFGAIYQVGGVGQDNGWLYWLLVFTFCTALYAFTAWQLEGEFFDYLPLLSGTGVLFTFTRFLGLPIEWSVVSVTLSGVLMAVLAGHYSKAGEAWREFARAARYLSQIVIPVSMVYISFSPGLPPVGQMIGFLLAAAGYFILSWQFPALIFAYAALGSSIGTVLFGLRVAELPWEWYPTAASILALIYIFIGQRARGAKVDPDLVKKYVTALNTTGLLMLSLAAIGGLVTALSNKPWAGVVALTFASLDLVLCAYYFQKSRYTLLASGLFLVPFSVAIIEWFGTVHMPTAAGIAWLSFAWGLLANLYAGLAAFLQRASAHNRWLYGWAHLLTPLALFILPFAFLVDAGNWTSGPSLFSLGISILFYLLSFLLQDSGRHPSLSAVAARLPYGFGKSIFLWPIGFLFPIWAAVAWYGTDLHRSWFGAVLAGFGLIYVGIGQALWKRAKEYRLPFHVFTYLLCIVGIYVSAPDAYSLLTTLVTAVIALSLLAYLYDRAIETIFASLLFVWPFDLSLNILSVLYYAQALGYMLLASLVYIPAAIYLTKVQRSREKFHHAPLFGVGYALAVYAVIESLILRTDEAFIPWVGVAIPLAAAVLFTFSTWYFRASKYSAVWAWVGMLTLTIAFGQALALFEVPGLYDALASVSLAAFFIIAERTLFFRSRKQPSEMTRFWSGMFHLPMIIFALTLAAVGLSLTLPETLEAFAGNRAKDYLPAILAQVALVSITIAAARLYQQRWLLFLEPYLALVPATLFFLVYGKQIFGQALSIPQYALIWTALGIIHVIAGFSLDRAKVRYAHGLYLGGYVLLSYAVLWSVPERSTLVWTLGFWILVSSASALPVHFHRHQTWDELLDVLFGKSKGILQTTARNAFQWLAAWTFPIWCAIFLREINVSEEFSWLGLALPPLAYHGLAWWLRRVDSAYAVPFLSAAQFFTCLVLLISAPTIVNGLLITASSEIRLLPFILLQIAAVSFYVSSAWLYRSRWFAHISAWLSIVVFIMAWRLYEPAATSIQLVAPWLMWSAVLLVIGFALDKNKVRYSHGPYLAGYTLMMLALARSTEVQITNIYALAITIVLALLSHLLVHYGRHHTFEDFINSLGKTADRITQQIVSTIFVFFAAYASPVLLAQYLDHIDSPVAWRGVGLTVAAPLYIVIGLLASNAKPRGRLTPVPTWALYSAGYALTFIGAMVAFEEERLGTYVLALNVVIYAVSAYLFRQALWLYLSTVLTPIIALLILPQSDRLEADWVAWILIVFAYLYLAIAWRFNRMKKTVSSDIDPFAAPFYAPGLVLSAIALAVASSDKTLAIQIYSAGVILYALSGWFFHEPLFIYPSAWLAAVPYYLAITLTPLEPRWHGLAWLPFIILSIAIGRIFFHKEPFAPLGKGALIQWLSHPAIPFYLLAYALSVSMIWLSYGNPLPLTLALTAGTALHMASAFLFRSPAWIYGGLLAAHLALLAYFTIDPKGGDAYLLSYPFHALTWLMALLGYGFSRWIRAANSESGSEAPKSNLAERLLGHPWACPFFLFAVMDIIVWQTIALKGYDTTITLAIGHTLLLALFSILWIEGSLVYDAVTFGLLAVGAALKQAQVPFGDAVAIFGGIGLGLYLLARILEPISARFKPLSVCLAPFARMSVFLTGASVLVDLPLAGTHMTATAASLAFAGALYISIAYRERQYLLGYLGMALLEIAWGMVLYANDVLQPQFYAIPGGLYFMGIAFLEMQQGRKRYAMSLELFGLGILLVTSFAQSLDGDIGLVYFVLLMFESLLVIWWGVLQKRKIPFFTGIGASAINIAAQVILLISVHDVQRVNRWLVAFGVGLLITGIAVVAELKREQLRARSRQLSEMLEKWE